MSEHDAVLFSNEAFYAAFAGRDMETMEGIWSHDENISVIHPGWEPIFGRAEVLASWRSIIDNPQSPEIYSRAAKAIVKDAVGTVVCFEEIGGNFLVATNLFVKENGRWCMFHHHAAPTTARPSEENRQPDSIN